MKITLAVLLLPAVLALDCPHNWVSYDGANCVGVVYGDDVTWDGAIDKCSQMNGKLVEARDEQLQSLLMSLALTSPSTSGFWMALTDEEQEGQFNW